MSIDVLEMPLAGSSTASNYEVAHLYCCDPDHAFCGINITGDTDAPDAMDSRPMCEDLAPHYQCRICGWVGFLHHGEVE